MKKKYLIIFSLLIVLIICISIFCYQKDIKNTYYFNPDVNNISKVVYVTNVNLGPKERKYTEITDKKAVQEIVNIYKGSKFKLNNKKLPGVSPNLDVYDKNNSIILSFSSYNDSLFYNDKMYTNFHLSKKQTDGFNEKLLKIVNKYKKSTTQ